MFISVIIPVYNVEKYLGKCIDKLLSQPYEDYEIILVNDGSSDKSGEICDFYASRHDNVYVIHQENSKCTFARRNGVKAAKGKYIVFVDSDDFVTDDYMRDLHEALKYEADYYILNNHIENKKRGEVYIEKNYLKEGYLKSIEEAYEIVVSGKAVAVWDKIYVREIFNKIVSDIEEAFVYGEDVYINCLYLEYVNKVYVHNSSSYYHILGVEGSATTFLDSGNLRRLQEIDIYYRTGKALIERKSISEKIRKDFEYFCVGNMLRTVSGLINGKVNKNEIIDILYSCELYNDSKKMKPNSLKFYVFCKLLSYRMLKITGLLIGD